MRWLSPVLIAAMVAGCNSTPPTVPSGPPPIEVAVRDSVVGRGKVIRLTNTGNKQLQLVRLELVGEGKEFKGVIAKAIKPHDTAEVGWTELGFAPVAGMSVKVTCNDYPEAVEHSIK